MADLKKHRMLIGGQWVEPASGAWFESLNPYTAAPWALIPRGGKDDVDRAVAAAKSAFYGDDWRKLTATARGALLFKLADLETDSRLGEIEPRGGRRKAAELHHAGERLKAIEADLRHPKNSLC